MTIEFLFILALIFLLISILYSSAGFGGGSSYLAFLALFEVDYMLIKSIALLCNIVVVSGNMIVFSRNQLLNLKRVAPLAMVSIPMAFMGGLYKLDAAVFFIFLGICLLLAGVLLLIGSKKNENTFRKGKQPAAMGSAMGIGLISGLVGIGGGIFLSPILHFIGWDSAKKIAATASFFIFVNSIAALGGHFIRSVPGEELFSALPLLVVVFIGGQIGSRITAYKLKPQQVKLLTAILVLIAGFKILTDQL